MNQVITRKESNNPAFRLEALLYIHQVEALEQANREVKRTNKLANGQTGMSPTLLLREGNNLTTTAVAMTRTRNHPNHQAGPEKGPQKEEDTRMMTASQTTKLPGHSHGHLLNEGDRDVTSMMDEGNDSDLVAKDLHTTSESQDSTRRQEEQRIRLDSGEMFPRRGFSHEDTPSDAAKHIPSSDLEALSLQEMQNEIIRLQETVHACYQSLQSVKKNADLKMQQLELKVLFLERKLADEQVLTNSLSMTNQALKLELQTAYTQYKEQDDKQKMKKMISLHQKEVAMENNLNSLRIARNEALHQNTVLQRMLLQTCYECRKKLPFRNARKNLIGESQEGASISHVEFQSALSSASSIGSASPRSRRTASAANESYVSSSTSSLSSLGMLPATPSSQFPESTELSRLERLSSDSLQFTEEEDYSTTGASVTASPQAVTRPMSGTGGCDHSDSTKTNLSPSSLPLPLIRTPTSRRKVVEMSMTPTTPTAPETSSTLSLSPSSHASPGQHSSRVSPKPRWLRLFTGTSSPFDGCHHIPKLKSSDNRTKQ